MSSNDETTSENISYHVADWVVDAVASSSDEEDTAEVVTLRKIPRFHEQQSLDDTLKRKTEATLRNKEVAELMKHSAIGPGFEQLRAVPPASASRRALKKERKKARDRTKGPQWFNLPVQEMTKEVKDDIDLLRMRSVIDPKRFYKNNDLSHIPKYFQIGTVLETPADFYSSRIPKAQRKKSLLGELMADAEAKALQKKKYREIMNSSHRRRKQNQGPKLAIRSKKNKGFA